MIKFLESFQIVKLKKTNNDDDPQNDIDKEVFDEIIIPIFPKAQR